MVTALHRAGGQRPRPLGSLRRSPMISGHGCSVGGSAHASFMQSEKSRRGRGKSRRRRACDGKVALSNEQARRTAVALTRKQGVKMDAYKCPFCYLPSGISRRAAQRGTSGTARLSGDGLVDAQHSPSGEVLPAVPDAPSDTDESRSGRQFSRNGDCCTDVCDGSVSSGGPEELGVALAGDVADEVLSAGVPQRCIDSLFQRVEVGEVVRAEVAAGSQKCQVGPCGC